MKKLDYLKTILNTESKEPIYTKRHWFVSCFTLIDETSQDAIKKLELYSIVKKPDGYYFINKVQEEEINLEKIDDAAKDAPLFNVREEIEIDSTFIGNVEGKIKTSIGNLLINAIAIYPSFGKKLSFVNGKINTGILENIIVPKIHKTDDAAKPGEIELDEFLSFVDRINYFANLADLFVLPGTEKSITVAPDFHKRKKEIVEKYKDKLKDPVEVINLEKELMALDAEYLKDDPTYGKMLSGSVLNIARKKMFIMYGDERGFSEKKVATPIVDALEDGWNTSENNFPSYMNALRSGSYARGAETVKGGVTSKTLLRSLGSLSIQDEPCDTTKGLKRVVTESNYTKFTQRYIKNNNKWTLVENDEEAKNLIGTEVEVRSAMFCKAPGYHICYQCLNESFKGNKNGITTLSLEISNVILYMFMKLMHGVTLSNATIELQDLSN